MKSANLLPTGSHSYAPASPVAAPVATERTTSTYYLPSGEPVQIDESVARGASMVSFQLASGKVVNARRGMVRPTLAVDAIVPSKATLLGHGR